MLLEIYIYYLVNNDNKYPCTHSDMYNVELFHEIGSRVAFAQIKPYQNLFYNKPLTFSLWNTFLQKKCLHKKKKRMSILINKLCSYTNFPPKQNLREKSKRKEIESSFKGDVMAALVSAVSVSQLSPRERRELMSEAGQKRGRRWGQWGVGL